MWLISIVSSNSRHLAKIEANYGVPTKWKVSKLTLDELSQWLLIGYYISSLEV